MTCRCIAAQAGVAQTVHDVEVGVSLGGDVVLEQRVVEHGAEVAVAVDAFELVLQLDDLLDLVADLGDVVHHLLHGLNQVGSVDDGDAAGVGQGCGEAAGDDTRDDARDSSETGELGARFHGELPSLG